ncbi:energy transducer TonB [Dyella sp. C9]|uniref:energy transducer TonB n=1 Tax=Dyella sp. C9 TaxID=2202154 RepID=UPI000DEF2AC9|nr:energy transducer TonB [Dyella sp. C9]
MLRLRTTTGLSLLALAVGVAGTAWLSGLTGHWAGPPAGQASAHVDRIRAVLRRRPRPSHEPMAAVRAGPPAQPGAVAQGLPMLTPLEMPPLAASLWKREPLVDGQVRLRLAIDGNGGVTRAEVAEGSGHEALDQRALRTVQHWRFAVPADHPAGLTGELLMRFEADTAPVAGPP